ncbi:tetratricopeptide repeat protein [Flavobacterium sp. SUN052]|uniref:tetratricopeptide repeat protein n=1 Tax=Flavobacterium sp. SUN052 TaxID=3002441 RepID=UPI00237E5F07|nr:tetratricopeptide repeat protein [Flavobacterium sp. SUN052]MEC4004091.1 tetratricopeptide repeat protein [Flavobacterium sp. SUN052]
MNEENYIAFESYLNNEMLSDEKIIFDEKLQNDAQFKADFNLYKETTSFIENKFDSKTIDFKANLKSISESHFSSSERQTKSKVIQFKTFYYAVAASVAILLGTWFFMQNSIPQYGDYNQHESANLLERGSVIKNLKAAQDAYNAKKYKVAIENFEIVLKEYDKPEVRYFYGISLLEENKFADAEATFTKLQSGTSIYKDKATWNLALSKLKQKQYEECKTYLKQLPEDAEDYEKAQKLLDKLD